MRIGKLIHNYPGRGIIFRPTKMETFRRKIDSPDTKTIQAPKLATFIDTHGSPSLPGEQLSLLYMIEITIERTDDKSKWVTRSKHRGKWVDGKGVDIEKGLGTHTTKERRGMYLKGNVNTPSLGRVVI